MAAASKVIVVAGQPKLIKISEKIVMIISTGNRVLTTDHFDL